MDAVPHIRDTMEHIRATDDARAMLAMLNCLLDELIRYVELSEVDWHIEDPDTQIIMKQLLVLLTRDIGKICEVMEDASGGVHPAAGCMSKIIKRAMVILDSRGGVVK